MKIFQTFTALPFHQSTRSNTSNNVTKLVLIIQMLQFIAIIIPKTGWGIWTYSDGPFRMLKYITSSLLITPLLYNQLTILRVCIVVSVLINITMGLIVIRLSYFTKLTTNAGLYAYLLVFPTILFLPQMSLYIGTLTIGKYSLLQNTDTYVYDFFSFLSCVGLIIIIVFENCTIYLMRCSQLIPQNSLQTKYSISQIITELFQIIIVTLYFQENTSFYDYIRLASIHLMLIQLILDTYYVNIYMPSISRFNFQIRLAAECLCILVSINVLSKNELIQEQHLLIFFLLTSSFSIPIGEELNFRKRIKLHQQFSVNNRNQEANQITFIDSSIEIIQDFYEIAMYIKDNPKHRLAVMYHQIIIQHRISCIRDCFKLDKIDYRQYIFCIIQTAQQCTKDGRNIESLQLLYVDYLAKFCRKPLLAFVELKKYENMENMVESYYFTCVKPLLNKQLQDQIQWSQQQKNRHSKQGYQERSLQIDDIISVQKLEAQYLPQIVQILDGKIRIWEQQIKGSNTIYEFQKMVTYNSSQIVKLTKGLSADFSFDLKHPKHIGMGNNVVEVKLASMYFGGVMNDFYSCSVCENLISEIFTLEHTLTGEIINNNAMVDDSVVMVMVSMVKRIGQIVNSNKSQLARYFEFEESEFMQVNSISQLVPDFMQDIHDQLMKDYLVQTNSDMFQQFKIVFSQSRQGFLQPQHLKLQNYFDIQDDYVVIGCLAKVKQNSEYILFGDNGKIMGVTQQFYYDLIYAYDETISLQKLLNGSYIFMHFPFILQILQENQDMLEKREHDKITIDQQTTLTARNNLREVMEVHSRMFRKGSDHKISNSQSSQYHNEQDIFKKSLGQTYKSNTGRTIKTNPMVGNIALFDEEYQQLIVQFLECIDVMNISTLQASTQPITKYVAKYSIQYVTVGNKQKSKSFFILELADIRKKDLMGNAYQSSVTQTKFESLQNNKSISMSPSSDITGFTQQEQPLAEISATQNKLMAQPSREINSILDKYRSISKRDMTDREPYLVGLDSGRDSISYGPLSQRANFISPVQKDVYIDDSKHFEVEFQDVKKGLSRNKSIEEEEDDNEANDQHQQASSIKESKSNKLLQIIKINKKQDIDIEGQQSRSSKTSNSSGNTGVLMIKQFQQSTKMIQDLQIITFISAMLLICFLILISVHLVTIESHYEVYVKQQTDIQAPMLFNRYFFKMYSFAWSLLYNSLKIVKSSNYILTQTVRGILAMESRVFSSLSAMYPTFIDIENRGLLQNVYIKFLEEAEMQVDFTYFITAIKNIVSVFFEIKKVTYNTTGEVLVKPFVDSCVTLRYNLKNVFDMNNQLIESLDQIYQSDIQKQLDYSKNFLIIEIVVVFIIIFAEIRFWKNIEVYKQQLSLIITRLQEKDANEMIYRAQFMKETITQQNTQYHWKRQNYFGINYKPLQALGNNESSKYLKNLGISLHASQNAENNKKSRNASTILSYRIQRTTISIMLPLIILVVTYSVCVIQYTGGYLLFIGQQDTIKPTNQLTLDFIRFVSQMDVMVTTSMVIKTQPLVYPAIVASGIYTQKQMSSYRDPLKSLFHMFLNTYLVYNQNLTKIYRNILQSDKIDTTDKTLLLALFEEDFCNELEDTINFCRLQELGIEQFTQLHEEPQPQDDNRDYVSQGIVGITSRLNAFYKESYDYEISNIDYIRNDTELSKYYINSKEFTNGLTEHFIDTAQGLVKFLDVLQTSTKRILDQDKTSLFLYYLVVGLSVAMLFIIIFGVWIYRTNVHLMYLRMGLTLIPLDILMDSHTLQLIKKLQ